MQTIKYLCHQVAPDFLDALPAGHSRHGAAHRTRDAVVINKRLNLHAQQVNSLRRLCDVL
jgi:hypothetical protein